MTRTISILTGLLLGMVAATSLSAQPFKETLKLPGNINVTVRCESPDGWHFSVSSAEEQEGSRTVKVSIDRNASATPPVFTIRVEAPQLDIHNFWTACTDDPFLKADWGGKYNSQIASSLPVYSFFNSNDENRLTMAVDEPFRLVKLKAGIREENSLAIAEYSFFTVPEAPLSSYSVTLRLDSRKVFWSEPISSASQWISDSKGFVPCRVPEAAFDPLYSSWYQFHQNVTADQIEAEAALAAQMGMKTIIIDDGWQTDDNHRGYAYCGEWKVAGNKFPDMPAHVKRVQDLGIKYMMWYSVPFVGINSSSYDTFKDKFLHSKYDGKVGILDPRFPEVREFLVGKYETALKEWNLDGFKLDFIDSFELEGPDRAAAENYAGRDIKSLQEAVDVLMKTVTARLQAIKPDILIEFRQRYIGPAIRQYGNMFRATDCPGNMKANRVRIADLRLTSGQTAVHADMLEWNKAETPQVAARNIINSIFGVVQYSVMLRDIPGEHRDVIRNWLNFSLEHRGALLKGGFRPHHKECGYPVIEAWDDNETIIGLYQDNAAAEIKVFSGRKVYVLNATGRDSVILDLKAKPRKACVVDAFGNSRKTKTPTKGLVRIEVPDGGYLILE